MDYARGISLDHVRDHVLIRREVMKALSAEARPADIKNQMFYNHISTANWRLLTAPQLAFSSLTWQERDSHYDKFGISAKLPNGFVSFTKPEDGDFLLIISLTVPEGTDAEENYRAVCDEFARRFEVRISRPE
jgi:hypothetical protein